MKQHPLDIQWFPLFLKFSSVSLIDAFEGAAQERTRQKKLFLEGEITHPTFSYPNLALKKLIEHIDGLSSMQEQMKKKEDHLIVKGAYQEQLRKKIIFYELCTAVEQQNMDTFLQHTVALYGAPSTRVFTETVQRLHAFLEFAKKQQQSSDLFSDAIQQAVSSVPPLTAHTSLEITDTLRAHVANYIYADCKAVEDFFQAHQSTQYTSQEIQQVITIALSIFGLSEWSVHIKNEHSVAIHINHMKKCIYIPADIQKSKQQMHNLVIHEIYTHILRRIHGEKSPLLLLATGLAGAYQAEEGIAILREEVLYPDVMDVRRLLLHFGIAMGIGIDGTPRAFRDVYTLLYPFFLVEGFLKKSEDSSAMRHAQEHAWNTTVRIFRGTDCHTPGVVFTKDISYREGRAQMWDVVREHPSEVARFNAGKYNPGNPQHRQWLDELGIV